MRLAETDAARPRTTSPSTSRTPSRASRARRPARSPAPGLAHAWSSCVLTLRRCPRVQSTVSEAITNGERMRTKDTTVAVLPDRLSEAMFDPASAQTATVVSLTDDGSPGGPARPRRSGRYRRDWPCRRRARRIDARSRSASRRRASSRTAIATRPIIVGFIETLQPDPRRIRRRPPVIEADVDGKRVRVTAQDEIVLQCGSASVTLRRNGRVIIRGTYVETPIGGHESHQGGPGSDQ